MGCEPRNDNGSLGDLVRRFFGVISSQCGLAEIDSHYKTVSKMKAFGSDLLLLSFT
jgi:hypothetical protein